MTCGFPTGDVMSCQLFTKTGASSRRDGDHRVVTDPGMVRHRSVILDPLDAINNPKTPQGRRRWFAGAWSMQAGTSPASSNRPKAAPPDRHPP